MRQAILLSFVTLFLFACGTENLATVPDDPVLTAAMAGASASGTVIMVSPSGDATGQTDPGAIEAALNSAGPGDVVLLSDGDPSTVDYYFASEGVVVYPGFDGTLAGEGRDNTIVHAVPQPDGSSFEFTFLSAFMAPAPTPPIWPTVFHFEYPDAVTVRDLAITQADPAPAADYFQHIAIWGGDPGVLLTNLRFSDPGRTFTSLAVHVMGGTAIFATDGAGSVEIRDNEFIGMGNGVVPMWYGPGARVRIHDNRFDQGKWEIWALNNTPTAFHIATNHFQDTERVALWIDDTDGVDVTANSFADSRGVGVLLRRVRNADISRNLFRDSYAALWFQSNIFVPDALYDSRIAVNTFVNVEFAPGVDGAAVQLWGAGAPIIGNVIERNDYVKSGIPGWSANSPLGPGAIWLGSGASGNSIHEMRFGPDHGKTLCKMIWDDTDDWTTRTYDGANDIHEWRPCEVLPPRGIAPPASFDPQPGFLTHH